MSRKTKTWIASAYARCEHCAWRVIVKNSLGLAAQHHDATGHTVLIEQVLKVIYGETGGDESEGRPEGR